VGSVNLKILGIVTKQGDSPKLWLNFQKEILSALLSSRYLITKTYFCNCMWRQWCLESYIILSKV